MSNTMQPPIVLKCLKIGGVQGYYCVKVLKILLKKIISRLMLSKQIIISDF